MFTSYDSPTEPYTSRTGLQSGPKPPTASPAARGVKPPVYSADGRTSRKKAKSGDIDYARLSEAMRYSRRVLEAFRTERTNAVKEYVGGHYSEGGAGHKVPVNLIARYVQVIGRSLVPQTPRCMFTTREKKQEPAVSAMQDWLNNRFKEMYFAETLRRWVVDSLFAIGIMKVALGTPADAAVSGYVSPAGVPFAESVDLDDFVFDAGVRDFRQAAFVGHRYRVPYDVAMKLDYFDGAAKEYLAGAVTHSSRNFNQEGDERVGMVGLPGEGMQQDFEDMVDLWEVYFPRQKKVVTFCSDAGGVPAGGVPPLRVQEWVGPNCGPFHFLALMPVPGNAMPKAPVQDLLDLHEFTNHGYRKLVNQMMRQKTVLPVRGGSVDDGKNLIQADDGDMFQCENADGMKEVSFGGPSPINAQFTTHLGDMFNKMAGNLDLLSGASPQSKTASQDKLLNENAGAGVADMQEQTITAIARVCDAMGWFWWYHPQEVMKTTRSLPGAPDISIQRNLHPRGAVDAGGKPQSFTRDGRYEDLNCRVDPYSLQFKTPQMRLQFLRELVTEMIPIIPLLGQQGIQFDAQAYLKKIAEYADEPDVITLFTVAEPLPQDAGGAGGGADSSRMPTSTSREYTRRSVGADTQANRTAEFDNATSAGAADAGP